MKRNLKKIIKQTPWMFHLWYCLYRKNRGVKINYFNKNSKLLLDGYPRSGNTFATVLFNGFFNKKIILHHFHSVAPIKMAMKKGLPVFILIREPKEAITSYYLKQYAMRHQSIPKEVNKQFLKELCLWYIDYYQFVNKNIYEIHIIKFEELIKSPKKMLAQINRKVFKKESEIPNEKLEKVISSYRGATSTFGSSKPNAKKEFHKKELKKVLLGFTEYQKASKTYHSIIA